MTEPIIASLADPEAGLVEHLMQAQLLINERNAYKRALANICEQENELCEAWFQEAINQLESEKINSGFVC